MGAVEEEAGAPLARAPSPEIVAATRAVMAWTVPEAGVGGSWADADKGSVAGAMGKS